MTRFKQKTILTYWCLPALSFSNYWALTVQHDLENKQPCSFQDQCTSYKRIKVKGRLLGWVYSVSKILHSLLWVKFEGNSWCFTVSVNEVYSVVFVIQIVCKWRKPPVSEEAITRKGSSGLAQNKFYFMW